MEKALHYLKSEYGYEDFDATQAFGREWTDLKSKFIDPTNKEEEQFIYHLIDDFMTDQIHTNKRRRRAY